MISVISIGNINIPLFILIFIVFAIAAYLLTKLIENNGNDRKEAFNDFQNMLYIGLIVWKLTPVFLNFSAFLNAPLSVILYSPGGTLGVITGVLLGGTYYIWKSCRKSLRIYKIALLTVLITSVASSDSLYRFFAPQITTEIPRTLLENLHDINGMPPEIPDLKTTDKPIILNFWASWCPPCKAEFPELESFYQQHNGNIAFYAVNMTSTETSVPNVKSFMNEMNLTIPILLDQKNALFSYFDVSSLPTTIIIKNVNSGGTEIQRHSGPISAGILKELVF